LGRALRWVSGFAEPKRAEKRVINKNQHWVTEAYLRAWCDAATPNGAFVWVASKKERLMRRASPKSLFTEEDFYSWNDESGNRNLAMEHKLRDIESKFIHVRDKKLREHVPLTEEDRYNLAVFVSTAFARTKRQKENGIQTWQDYIQMVDGLPPALSNRIRASKDYQDVIRLHKDQPLLFHLYQFVNTTAPYLFLLNCAIYETNLSPGIITSDNPCIWIDPAVALPSARTTYFGVGSPSLNVLFPVSPRQYLSFEQKVPMVI
jgi:hypothetical protein